MSWGERSCAYSYSNMRPGPGAPTSAGRPCVPTSATCNVDCPYYEWDGSTPPDSEPDKQRRLRQRREDQPVSRRSISALSRNQRKRRSRRERGRR